MTGKQAIALLSQEGSVIAFSDDARGGSLDEILQNAFLKANLWNHPPHDLDYCLDRAALLTQEGHSANLDIFRRLQCVNGELIWPGAVSAL